MWKQKHALRKRDHMIGANQASIWMSVDIRVSRVEAKARMTA